MTTSRPHRISTTSMHAIDFAERSRAAIVYYPPCGIPAASMTAPTLILIGEGDEWSLVKLCREMVARARPDGAPIAPTVYPGGDHYSNVDKLVHGIRNLGYWLNYNEPAAKDAEEKTHAFLALHLAGTAPGQPTAK